MPNSVLTRAIDAVASGRDLSADEAAAVLREVMTDNASEVEIAGFLIGLRAKGETVDELTGLARTMRELAASVQVADDDLLDTAGTGGGRPSFNVSTTAALIAAGAGCRVAKHGNRSATSRSGSADVLEALGVRIDLGPDEVADCIREVGFGFMFAPSHHAATRWVVPVRKELAVRTIFNFLGPLTNPAGATRQLIGVSDPAYLEVMAGAIARLGARRALVVSSEDGMDELSTSAATQVVEVDGPRIERYAIAPEDLGLERVSETAIGGGDPEHNARATRSILAGERGPGARPGGAQRRRGDLRRRRGGVARRRASGRAARDRRRVGGRGARALRGQDPRAGGDARVNVLERIVESTRADIERRRREVPLDQLESQLARRDERPFSEALIRPGISVIAEYKRRSPSAGSLSPSTEVADVVRGLRARRRGRDLRAHRARALRGLARGPARRPRRVAARDPAQGLRRRPLPALRVGGRRRRRRAADRGGAASGRPRAACTPRRWRWTSTCSSRSTTSTSSRSRWRPTPT